MNDLMLVEKLGDRIKNMIDNSDNNVARLRVYFKNGYGISIIRGLGSYGNEKDLFEIAPLNKDDCLDGSLLKLDDDVEGWLTEEDVLERCEIISNL